MSTAEAVDVLAGARFTFPTEAKRLWSADDLLSAPDVPDFAQEAARFLTEHPIPPPGGSEDTAWELPGVASRQCKCLGWLAAGKKESRPEIARLCVAQATWMQWMFPVRVGWSLDADEQAFGVAAGSLAFTGEVVRRAAPKHSLLYEVATQWLRTGLGQLATYGEKAPDASRESAEALVKAVGVSAGSAGIHGTDEAFFGALDLDRPDMRDVARCANAEDWKAAEKAYVDLLGKRFSNMDARRDAPPSQDVDLSEADDMCRNIFILKAHMHRRYDFGKHVDFSAVIDDDIESRVSMNAHAWAEILLRAYQQTGDDKYVSHLCRLLNAWYEESPPPLVRSDAQWRTLEVGGRAGRWVDFLMPLAEHPLFKERTLFNMARSMLDHGKYLCMYAASGGNWLQNESVGLTVVSILFPEFTLSPLFREVGMNRLLRENARTFLPDGFQSECSVAYHCFPVKRITHLAELARWNGVSPPERLLEDCERTQQAAMYIAYPDGTLPNLSDSAPRRVSVRSLLSRGVKLFDRPDFAWVATGGGGGNPPAETSHDFTHAGYCVMRSGWDSDADVLIFDAGYFGSSHQHEDKLNFVYYAGGRELIGDPGIYSYKFDEFEPYWRGTWSHNSIVIDGLSQHRGLGAEEEIPDPDRRFVTGDEFDFAVGWYRHAYSPRKTFRWGGLMSSEHAADLAAAVRNVEHQRCIFFVKRCYAIICDRVVGEGEHGIDIIFRPAPVVRGEDVRAVDLEIRTDGTVLTTETDDANVAILPADDEGLQVLDLIGQKDPVRGWVALWGIEPSHDIVYRRRRRLPAHFETVVQPLPPGDAAPLNVRSVPVECAEGKSVAAIACGRDLFLLSYEGRVRMSCDGVVFEGTALFLKRDANGRASEALMVDGRALVIDGEDVFSTDRPTPTRSVRLGPA